MELKQLEHLKEVSGEFVKVIKGINTRFESILDGLVVGVSNRWNDVFRLVGANGGWGRMVVVATLCQNTSSLSLWTKISSNGSFTGKRLTLCLECLNSLENIR